MKENKPTNFHLIGIGGIGMSALARFLMERDNSVSGSDPSTSGEGLKIEKEGATVFRSHHEGNIESSETTVVYSTAIAKDNPEIKEAKRLGCRLWHRSDLLAHLMESYESMAVAGTHGKTSTSALLSHVLLVAGKSPSFVIGGLVQPRNTNSFVGEGPYFVAEADESDGSFLNYDPTAAIITNLEEDHLNHYKDLEEIKGDFSKFIENVKDSKKLLWCKDCKNLASLRPPGVSYGFNKDADLKVSHFRQKGWGVLFDISFQGKVYSNIQLSLIGKHNALNAAAIFGMCLLNRIDEGKIREAFQNFKGVKRRGEFVGEASHVSIYDDYAHHPTEVECLLKGFRKAFPKRRIIALFQPHRYSRFLPFKEAFASSFKKASEVWVDDVYAAGEKPLEDLDLNEYATLIETSSHVSATYVKDKKSFFLKNIKPHDILITIGAGDITAFSKEAHNLLKENRPKMKLGLIKGSISYEHYVSLVSSRFYEKSVDKDLYDLTVFKISLTGDWILEDGEVEKLLTKQEAIDKLLECDCVLPILHGSQGEDGMIQGFLETLKIPYCGPNYALSSFNMNKIWMKLFVKEMGIPVPKGFSVSRREFQKNMNAVIRRIEKNLRYSLVVKPASMGSTLGVTFVSDREELKQALEHVFTLDENGVIEERIFGRELEVSCFETEEGLKVAPPGEVKSDVRDYDYQAKYSSTPIEKIVSPALDEKVKERAQLLAKNIYKAMQIKSYCRIDFFLTKKNQLIFAEVNTQPGTTPRSLFHRTLIADGIEEKEIINQSVIDALYRRRLANRKSIQMRQFLKSIKDVTHT